MVKYAIALTLALLLNAAANLMIRFGMRAIDIELNGAGLLDGGVWAIGGVLLRHWILLAGLACFALNIVFYSYALQKLPISMAYPVMTTAGFVIIVTVAGFALNERLSMVQWFGVVAVLFGVVLIAKDAGRQMSFQHVRALPASASEPSGARGPQSQQ